ncbi:thiamine phosphate synthase [Roseospira marina]|uniref:Thiamine phosphate synthase n=2 Tax=Roseospira marina TaxID=140057 RepID=A0A5M6I8Z3_9PROT|nr:thiamine phosphate synthase [Roseospira marina]
MASADTLARAAARLKPARAPEGGALPRAWLVSDPVRLPDPGPMLARMPRGAALLWRPYGLDRAGAERQGRVLRRLTRRLGVRLLVAGDARRAVVLGADGLHLPEGLARHGILAPLLLWHRAGRPRWLCVAAHGPRALARARALGADVAVLSPVFPTASHPGAPVLGPVRFARLAARAGLPLVALGGITAVTARRLPPGCVVGLAAVSGWAAPGHRV